MMKVLLFVAIIGNILAEQVVPIPKKQYGLSFGDKNGSLNVKFFMDLLCVDSRASYLTLLEVFRTIDLDKLKVKFTYEYVPLAFHFYAIKAHQGLIYVLNNKGQAAALRYIEYIFKNQDRFGQEQWISKTLNEFYDGFSSIIATEFALNKTSFRQALAFGSPQFTTTRYNWKYSVGSHGVAGAPIFFANDVLIDGAENYKFEQWIKFFKEYSSATL